MSGSVRLRPLVAPHRSTDLAHLYDDVVGANGPWQASGPLLLGSADYRRLGDVSVRAARLVLAACRRRARTAGELLTALGSPAAMFPLLDRDEVLGEHLLAAMRPDILVERGTPRFVELNIDGALGGVAQVDTISSRFLDHFRRTGLAPGELSAPSSALDARARAIRDFLRLADGSHVLMPYYPAGGHREVDSFSRFAAWLQPVFDHAKRHGMTMSTHPLDRLTTDTDGRLLAAGQPVDAVFRPFVSHGQPASEGLAALGRSLAAGMLRMFTPEATMLLTNKRTLAWLWDDLAHLSCPDRDFVTAHVPRTTLLRPDGRGPDGTLSWAVANRAELVLKPADGFGGSGVVIGAATSPEAWRGELDRALEEGPSVLQQHVRADRVALGFVHGATRRCRPADVPYVLGPFLYGLRVSGLLVRHGTPVGDGVLNARRGALLNSVLLTPSPKAEAAVE